VPPLECLVETCCAYLTILPSLSWLVASYMVRVLVHGQEGGWYGEGAIWQLGFGKKNGINVAAVRHRIYVNNRYLFA
jgi:hypothetical protein